MIHGDEFDQVTRYRRWLAVLGDRAYDLVVRLNALLSWLRRRLGVTGYWSLSGYAKRKVKRAVGFIFDFEEAVARYVKERGVDGVVRGHIHSASVKEIDGIRYINCGDWVDRCTAIVEHRDGRIELIEWDARATESEPRADAAPVSLAAPKATAAVLEERRAPLRLERIRVAGADQ